MYDLTKADYKAVLDLFTSLVNVKSISAFCHMLSSAKEQLGIRSFILLEIEFHKTCTHKLIYSDTKTFSKLNNYIVPDDHFRADPVLKAVLEGDEVIRTTQLPSYFVDIFTGDMNDIEGLNRHLLVKLNKETMIADMIVFTIETDADSARFSSLAGYMHAHLLSTFVGIMSAKDEVIERLSDREISVLTWLKYGKTSWEIAKILDITENTVNFHIKNIKSKLNATNRQHAVAIALARHIIK